MTDTTIDILAQELQNKENRISKLREKLLEQQEHLKYKIKRINELKEEVINIGQGKIMAEYYSEDKFKEFIAEKDEEIASLVELGDQKNEEIAALKDRLRVSDNIIKEQDAELSYSRGEHPIQKAADRKRKKPNGKSKGTNIN